MPDASPTDHAVPGAVIVRIDRRDGALELGLRGVLDDEDPGQVRAVVAELVGQGARGEEPVRLVADHPIDRWWPLPLLVAEQLGLDHVRDLFQLRRPLPVAADDPVRDGTRALPLRPFDPDRDAAAWVRQNNRAFAHHPSQGDQTLATLAATLAEPWVDLDGFLVLDDPDRPGELAGSCWTRVHPATDDEPELGEIFVIGVDPTHHGAGLGRTLVLAGLDHLAAGGTSHGMLYVEADNEPALALYRRLGFAPHLRRRICSR